jgi:flagellar protein FlgJ
MEIATNPTLSLMAQATRNTPPSAEVKAREAAEKFESFYIAQFISLMKPENTDAEFNGGTGERMFRQELNNELAKSITKGGGFGIADTVYRALMQQQERP